MLEFKFEFDLVLCTIQVFQHNVLFEFLYQEGACMSNDVVDIW